MSYEKTQFREGCWLSKARIITFTRALFLFELAMLVFFIAGTHGLIVPLQGATTTDFVSFYGAGSLTITGNSSLVYDQAAHYAAEQHATEPGIAYNYFFYPPIFLLLCGPLALLPYLIAFYAFQAATLGPCLLAVRAILPKARLLSLLAFPAVFWTLGTGQNAFLSAGLFAGAMLCIDRRPVVAGLLLGALCYKPHFGLLIPVALAAGGHWRAFAAAAVSTVGLAVLTLGLFGWETWLAYFAAAARSQPIYTGHMIDMTGLTTPFGAVIVLGGSALLAGIAQGVTMLVVAGLVARIWWRGASLPVRAAALIAGTVLAAPIVMFYDLMLDGIAMAWLVRAGQTEGFPAWQRPAMALLYLMPVLSGNLGGDSNLLIPPLTALGCFALTLSQARHESRSPPMLTGAAAPG